MTLDLHNRGERTVEIDLSKAMQTSEPVVGGDRMIARAVASGNGELPVDVDLRAGLVGNPILRPGEGCTVWVVFEAFPPSSDKRPHRGFVRIPVRNADEIAIKLADPEHSPHWRIPEATNGAGVGLLLKVRHMGDDNGLSIFPVSPGLSFWYWHRSLMGAISFEPAQLVLEGDRQSKRGTAWLSLSAAWVPENWNLGAYVSGDLLAGDFKGTSYGPRLTRFASSAGLIIRSSFGWPAACVLRIGIVRVFGVAAHGHGMTVGLEVAGF